MLQSYEKNTVIRYGKKLAYLFNKPIVMRLFLMLLTISMHISVFALGQKITLKRQNAPLTSVIKEIKKQSGYNILYDAVALSNTPPINITIQNADISEALDKCLYGLSLGYVIKGENIIISKKSFVAPKLVIQQVTVKGKITDISGQALDGASVSVKGNQGTGTTTNAEGGFVLNVPSLNVTLVVSYVGHLSQEIALNGRNSINISLQPENANLEEVVVVGYGTQRRKDLTGSVASLPAQEIKDLAVPRVEQALSGRVPGVQVKLSDGTPGGAPQIRIRGIGSISAGTDPLYVVDGFPTDNIQTLNPNDIESMDILKDASATAIYGSRGSNGVVIINTKRGASGQAKINFDAYYGVQSVSRTPKFMNAQQQADYYYHSIMNRNLDLGNDISGDPATWPIRVPQTALDVLSGANTTDVSALDAVLRTAPQQAYNLSFTGGSPNVKYAISGEYMDQDGIILNSNFKRYSLRSNIDAQLGDKLSLKLNVNPSFTSNTNVIARGNGAGASTSIIGSATSAQPYYPLYNPDGSYFIYDNIDASTQLYNPIALALEKKDLATRARVLANFTAQYQLTKDLKLNVLLGATLNNQKGSTFTPQLPVFLNNLATGTDTALSGYNWLTEYTANYDKSFGKHNLSLLAGYTVQEEVNQQNSLSSNNFPNNLVPYLSAVSGIIMDGTALRDEWSLISQLARVNYNFDDKYLVTASIRRDGSSRFGANNKYGVFPSAALAWRISEEEFFKGISFADQWKLRLSYGKTGNNNIGNYASIATVNYVKYVSGGAAVGGFVPSIIPNPDLTWETQEQLNAGMDIGLFKGRLNMTLDYFTSKNKDLLLNVNVPTATGFSTSLQNIGEVRNKGWEFVINSINIDGTFKWSTDINFSTYRNKVVKLGPSGDDIISGNNITRIGQPIGMFYGFIADGIFRNAEELAAGPIYNPGLSDDSRMGDIRFKDVSGPNGVPDGIITNDDLTIIGNPYPDFYYGMTNRLSYKNFSLSFNLAGSYGGQIYNNAFTVYRLIRSRSRTLATELNYWKSEEDPGDGKTVRPNDVPRGGLRLASTRYMDTGSYLRINNITIGYLLPDKVAKSLRFESLRLYINATNPFTFTKNLSFNPDVSDNGSALNPGIDVNNYPLPKSIVAGINVTF